MSLPLVMRPIVNCVHHDGLDCAARRYDRPSPGVCGLICPHREPRDAHGAIVLGEQPGPPNTPAIDWHALWDELHSRPWQRDADPGRERLWLRAFGERIPCGSCWEHYTAWLAATPPDVSDADRYFEATWALHESVNAKLGKPGLALDEARARHAR